MRANFRFTCVAAVMGVLLMHATLSSKAYADTVLALQSTRVHIGDEPALNATRFPDWGPFVGTSWEISFFLAAQPTSSTLYIESFDVEAPPDFLDKVSVNGSFIADLAYVGDPSWYSSAQAIAVPSNILHPGTNALRIDSGYGQGIYASPTYDDFGVGQVNLSYSADAAEVPTPAIVPSAMVLIGLTFVGSAQQRTRPRLPPMRS